MVGLALQKYKIVLVLYIYIYINPVLPRYYLHDTFRAFSCAELKITSISFLVVVDNVQEGNVQEFIVQ